MQSVCVFLGSSAGLLPAYAQAAELLGVALAARGLTLVYGAGNVGLMGVLANAVLASGGRVVGVIPESLMERELGHLELSELYVVESMHARKAKMAEQSDAFIILPGGLGTLEEFFEVLTWAQLGFHRKPIGLLNVHGYYAPLLDFLDHAVTEGFVAPTHRSLIKVSESVDVLFDQLQAAWRRDDGIQTKTL
jgi:uncharacterized protein (TIGR00730 family)